ncbi:hypothetical protein LTT66_00790 [Nocardia gipuzkoensis]|uniref:hypothetical protein n=1 Tax=Nocardia gipuzkoensis TaxID=2749991 RepID=UPI001E630F01|nr:hypothetical protein [Nocardia gipuzkoensis]UGT68808.1 hypothetical protein LTT66_00790 [Nocardia gipuzkoensis]
MHHADSHTVEAIRRAIEGSEASGHPEGAAIPSGLIGATTVVWSAPTLRRDSDVAAHVLLELPWLVTG